MIKINLNNQKADSYINIKLIEKYINRDKKALIQYYKVTKYNAKGCKRTIRKGMFISVPIYENTIVISWSACNPKDKFNKMIGWLEAYKKIENNTNIIPMIDSKMERSFVKFIKRCERYYKDKKIISY